MPELTDEQIVTLYESRDESAISETDRKYGRYCRYIADSILPDRQDAEEIVNDTYLKAWNSIPPAKPNPLKSFLGCITRRLSLNRLERENARRRGGGQYAVCLDELSECLPDGEGESVPDGAALSDSLDRFLNGLNEEDKRLFVRRYWFMIPVNELARETASGESRIKSRLMRLRERLREHLTREGFTV